MADNFVTNAGSGGSTFAADDVGGVLYPRSKSNWGVDGASVDTSLTNPIPIQPAATNFIFSASGQNTTTTQLVAAATFTGTIESTSSQQCISILLTCDQNGTLVIEQFIDAAGTFKSNSWTFTTVANVPFSNNFIANGNYARIKFTNNGGATTTTLNLNTAYGTLPSVNDAGYTPVSITSGTNAATVKAASTAAATTDTSLVVSLSPNNAVTLPTLTKGTQGATGISSQDLKDSGRTHVNYYAVAAAAGATGVETAITLTKSSGTSATSTGASFVITSGKTFRITSITVATRGNATATVQTTTFNLRLNTAGSVTTTSTPVLLSARSATPATASAWDRFPLIIPDGFEIVGNGTIQFGMTAAATFVTNAPTWDVVITGFEY